MPMQEYEVVNTDEHRGYTLQSHNPFGHWKILNPEGQGPVPSKLQGRYTTLPDATQAIDAYMNNLEQQMLAKNHVEKQIVANEKKAAVKEEEVAKAVAEQKLTAQCEPKTKK